MALLPASRVVIPLDLSPFSLQALDRVREVITEVEALHVITVLPELAPHELGAAWGTVDDTSRIASVRELLHQELDERDLRGAHTHVIVDSGNPGRHVTRIARELGAELILLTSHGRTGIAHLTLGSVAERVVRTAACPVLVIKNLDPAATSKGEP